MTIFQIQILATFLLGFGSGMAAFLYIDWRVSREQPKPKNRRISGGVRGPFTSVAQGRRGGEK